MSEHAIEEEFCKRSVTPVTRQERFQYDAGRIVSEIIFRKSNAHFPGAFFTGVVEDEVEDRT